MTKRVEYTAECHEHDHPICEPGCPANIGEDHDHPIEQESAR